MKTKVPTRTQQRGADRHEERIDVRLTVNHVRNRRRTWIGLANLEIGRIGDDGVETLRLRARRKKSARPHRIGVRQDEVRRFNTHTDGCSVPFPAPSGEMVEHGPERRDQVTVDLVGNQLDCVGFRPPRYERFHGRAAENARAGGGIKNPNLSPCRRGPGTHEVGGLYRREKKSVYLALPVGRLASVPFANAIGIACWALTFQGARHGGAQRARSNRLA